MYTRLGRLRRIEPIDCWLSGVEASYTTGVLPFPSTPLRELDVCMETTT